jgi:LPPG:FO 2-phospho-L-lactate transferase
MGKNIVALSGGVGGAKMVDGLAGVLTPPELTVIVNVADDFEWFGLTVCPDVDTIVYTLAGVENPSTGWGINEDTFACLEALQKLGAPSWFRVGDRDLATHLARSRWLWEGIPLTEAVQRLCKTYGVQQRVLPATDDALRTIVETDAGDLEFQEYFVRLHFEPEVRGFHWKGQATASASEAVLSAIATADLVVICPSNPFVSIDPILVLPGVRDAISARPCIAVSPLIAGKAVKGPAEKMFRELGRKPSAYEVAMEYRGLLKGFILDQSDHVESGPIADLGMQVFAADTRMTDRAARVRLASCILDFGRAAGWL